MKQKNAYSGLSLFICFVLVTLSLKSEAYAWPCSSQSDVTNKTSSYLCDDLHPYPCEDTTVGNCQYPSSNYSDTDNYWFSTKTKSVNISGINHTVFYAICKGYRETGAPSPNVATFAPYIAGANRTICSAKCPTGCSSCSIKNKKEGLLKCGGCSSGYTKQGDLCCHSGYYVPTHNASNSCTKCPDNYKTCSGNSFTCKAGFYKNGNTCKACPAGTYSADGNTAASCTACPTECSACTSASVCTACSDGYGLIDHSCVKTETYTIEFYDKSGKFHTESKTGTPKNVSVYTGYLYGNIDKHYYSCATDKENKKVICSCSGAGSSWHGYFKDKSRCEAWINSQSGFCDVIDGYSSSHPNCQYVAKYCSRGCKKCTSSSNCTECSSGFRLENSYCKEVKEYSIKFTDKKGSVGKDSTELFYPGTENDIITQFKALGKYKSNVARCSADTVGQEIECTCTLADTAYFLDMDRCSWYKDKLYTEGSDGIYCKTNDATDKICPVKSTKCPINCLKCQSTDTCDQCKDGYTWNSTEKKCLPNGSHPVSCPSPLAYSADGRSCEFKCTE